MNWEELKSRIRLLPAPTPEEMNWQRLSWSYANLALTTNHKPQLAAFRAIARDLEISDGEFEVWAAQKEWW